MKTKADKTTKLVIRMAIGLAVMITSGLIGVFSGAFTDVGDAIRTITIDGRSLLKLFIMASFLVALSAVIQMVFHLLPVKANRAKTMITVLSSLLKYAFVLIGVCWGLSILGVNVSTIFASVGVLALIIGFGAESLVSDLVTGAFILFENQYNVGDIVELDGYRGTVDFIGIRTTGIRDAGDNVKIINNSDIKNIVNRSERGSVAVTTVGISYALDLEEVEKQIPGILEDIKASNPDIFIGNVSYLGVDELADSSVVMKFIANVDESNIFKGRRLLNRELKVRFDRAGIEIAYPQMDVHMR